MIQVTEQLIENGQIVGIYYRLINPAHIITAERHYNGSSTILILSNDIEITTEENFTQIQEKIKNDL